METGLGWMDGVGGLGQQRNDGVGCKRERSRERSERVMSPRAYVTE